MAQKASLGDRLAQVLPTLYALARIDQFPAVATSAAIDLIGADKAEFTEVDRKTGDFFTYVSPRPALLDQLVEERRVHMGQHPGLRHFLRTGGTEVVLISDFGKRAFRSSGLYGEFYRHLGVEDQMGVGIADANERRRVGISLDRGKPGFSPEDRYAISLLRPHLVQARLNALLYSAALAQPNHDGTGSARFERLSERQNEVTAKLAQGLTNIQIAHALDISPGTVRKHVENIMRELKLPTRTAVAVEHIRAFRSPPEPVWTAIVDSMFDDAVLTS